MSGRTAAKPALTCAQRHAILRPLRAGQRRLDGREIELQHVGEDGPRLALAPQPLRLAVGLDQGDALGRPAGGLEVLDGVGVDGEEAAGGAVLRRHVADGGAILDGEMIEAVAEILDELLDHAALAQHLRAGEHEVGGGDAFLELALEAEADHLGDDHGDGLAEHGGLRLDAADAPAEHAQRVDHGGVAVGADAGVGERLLELAGLLGPHRLRQVLEVDLVADAGARRHHLEVVEGAGAPAQELVALLVALVLDLDVLLEGVGRAEEVDLHGMVDDEVDGHQRVDLGGIAAERLHGVAHGGEVDHRRHAGEVLHQHARRAIGDLAGRGLVLQPVDHGADVVGLDRAPVLVPQQVLDQHLEGEGQLGDAGQPVLLGVGEGEVLVGLGADLEGLAAFEGVGDAGAALMVGDLLAIRLPTACAQSAALQAVGRGRVRPHHTGLAADPGLIKRF